MISIWLPDEQQWLDMPDDASVTLRLENPLLADDVRLSPGSYSYPFSLPVGKASPHNERLLKFPSATDAAYVYAMQRADLFFGGIFMRRGYLQKQEVRGTAGSYNLLYGLSQATDDVKTLRLRNVVDETIVMLNTTFVKRIYFSRPSGNHNIVVNGTTYTGTNSAVVTAINNAGAQSNNTGKPVAFATLVSSGSAPPPNIIAAPYIELKSVVYTNGTPVNVTGIDTELSLNVNDATINYFFGSNISDYNLALVDFFTPYMQGAEPDDKIRFPALLNGAKYKDTGIVADEFVNRTISGVGGSVMQLNQQIITSGATLVVRNVNSVQPFTTVKHVLDKIAEALDVTLEGDFYTDPLLVDRLIYNTAALDVPLKFFGDNKYVFFRNSFNMSELVPDIKVVDFLKALQTRYNLGIYFDERRRVLRMVYLEPVGLRTTYTDITDFCSEAQSITHEPFDGYTLTLEDDEKDLSAQTEQYKSGTGEREFKVQCGRLFEQNFFAIGGQVPRVQQNFGEAFTLKLFHYDVVPVLSRTHPIGSIDGPGADGYDLESVHNNYWRYWLRYMSNRRTIKIKAALPLQFLLDIDFERKVRYAHNNYLIKSIETRLSMQGVGVADVELISMM